MASKLIKICIFFTMLFTLFPSATFADKRVIIDVPFVKQKPELPRGCEVTSLTMLLQDAGVLVNKMTLAKEVEKVPFQKDGFHGNPYDGFVGDMYTFSKPGLGVYHGPIAELANKYLPGRIVDFTGKPVGEIYKYIDKGSPVWVITNSKFQRLPDYKFITWKTHSGPIRITYHEHSVVVTGYDAKYVYINDPLYMMKNRRISRAMFEQSWYQMGQQAISYLSEREVAYQMASKNGEILQNVHVSFEQATNSENIIEVNNQYDSFTKQLKVVETLIGKVYGSQNRNQLLDTYVFPAKVAKERVIYEVSQLRLLNKIKVLIEDENVNEIEKSLKILDRLKRRAIQIKQSSNYEGYSPLRFQQLEDNESAIREQFEQLKLKTDPQLPNNPDE